MALAILLFVFFIVVVMIAFFVFPPTGWVSWFYHEELNEQDSSQGKTESPKPDQKS